jgi:hypothetical protein
MGGDESVVLGNDVIVPYGNYVRGELGYRCGSNRLENAMNANDVRPEFLHVWLDCRMRKGMVDERVRIWFYNVVMRCLYGVAD